MSIAISNLQAAQHAAMSKHPAVQGFPHLAEVLRRAGVRTNTWWLPAMQSLYETDLGPVVVLRYVVDLENRTCTYFGLDGETYVESYPAAV